MAEAEVAQNVDRSNCLKAFRTAQEGNTRRI